MSTKVLFYVMYVGPTKYSNFPIHSKVTCGDDDVKEKQVNIF